MAGLYIRYANKEDLDILFNWANDPIVRQNSFSTDVITIEEHKLWFDNMLNRSDAKQYIYMNGDIPIGQAKVRIERDIAEIGYSIAQEYRGNGYGSKLLIDLKKQVIIDFPSITKIIGRVKDNNISSKKAFTSAGYNCDYLMFSYDISKIRNDNGTYQS